MNCEFMIWFSLNFNIYKYETNSFSLFSLRFQYSSYCRELFYKHSQIVEIKDNYFSKMLFKYSEFLMAAVPQVLLKNIKAVC